MAKKKAQTKSVKTHALDTPKYLDLYNKDPNKAYRYIKRDDIGRRKTMGYVVTDDSKVEGPSYDGSSQIGTHDLILMETSIENRDALRAVPIERQRRRMEGSTADENYLDSGMNDTVITKKTLPSGGDADTIFDS